MGNLQNVIFSDEKLFVVEQAHNSKNDVVYALSIEHVPEKSRSVQRFQKSNGVMVWEPRKLRKLRTCEIASNEWPPSSPDLNPLDYSVWGVLEARGNATIRRSLNSLKQKLIKEWDRLSMD